MSPAPAEPRRVLKTPQEDDPGAPYLRARRARVPFTSRAMRPVVALSVAVVGMMVGTTAVAASSTGVQNVSVQLSSDAAITGLTSAVLALVQRNQDDAQALADADVVPVFASAQNPGERPQDATDARQLFWFATKP